MNNYILYDNSYVNKDIAELSLVKNLLNKNFSNLNRENFIIFPNHFQEAVDIDKEDYIFELKNGTVRTCNIAGIIGNNEHEFKINSRFSNESLGEDYFLRYMLATVLNYNVVDNKVGISEDSSYYDLLTFLFPYYLNKALKKGLYKEYITKKYNDSNVKGTIDIARHIKNNLPFVGKVAYNTREYSYDNKVTQLIRHTVEKIKSEKNFLLSSSEETKDNVKLIVEATSSFNNLDKADVIFDNINNIVRHGYYEEYYDLQQLCLKILRDDKVAFNNKDDKGYGIIFNVAWLWEEYIAKVTGWKHYGRSKNLNTLHLFSNKTSQRYPDFVFNNIPIDTKYKKELDKRNDYNQIVTYLYILNNCNSNNIVGGFLQPSSDESKIGIKSLGMLNGFGGKIFTYYFYIPQEVNSYEEFIESIKVEEETLKKIKWS